jgi:hypothetical protein
VSADRTAPAPHPDRAWRETFLARFDPDRAELLERFGGLEHLALCLCEVAATPVHSEVSRPELALCHAASGWADYLEIAVHALRRDAGSERRAPP